jgi:hypothetical protein
MEVNLLNEKQQTVSIVIKSPERRRGKKRTDSFFPFFLFSISFEFFFSSENIIDAYRFGTIVILVSFNQVSLSLVSFFSRATRDESLAFLFIRHSVRSEKYSIYHHTYRNTSNALLDFFSLFFFFFSRLLLSIFLFPSLTFGDCLSVVHKRLVAVRNHVSVQPVRCSSIPIFQIR